MSDAEIAAADFVLSIVPPGEALPLAQRLAPALTAANKKPVYADCNAVSPDTVKEHRRSDRANRRPFVDAGIIGGPPRAGYNGPIFYVSGPKMQAESRRSTIRPSSSAAWTARSARRPRSRCRYGGITKGLIALGSAMVLAAERAGVAEALHAELAASQPTCSPSLPAACRTCSARPIAGSRRWRRSRISPAAGSQSEMYQAIAALYERLAEDCEGRKAEVNALAGFFEKAASPKSRLDALACPLHPPACIA